MAENNHKKLAKEWLDIGRNDFNFAQISFKELSSFYPQICFLCQQAAEKHLKGFLIYHQRKFPKIHDLTQLVKLCAKIDKSFLEFLDLADRLSQHYLTSRYPLIYQIAEKKDAEEALSAAEKIINFIMKKI